jgi:hypothetical protein
MHRIVHGNCKCGSNRLVVTRERPEHAIDGYCPQCMQVFSGGYLFVDSPEPARIKSTPAPARESL